MNNTTLQIAGIVAVADYFLDSKHEHAVRNAVILGALTYFAVNYVNANGGLFTGNSGVSANYPGASYGF